MADERDGEIVEDDYQWDTATRHYRVFSLMESEMETLIWAPFWVRRRLIERVRRETKFDAPETDYSGIVREGDGLNAANS